MKTGQAVAEFLASHPKIAYVDYCGLPGNAYHAAAQKYLPNGSCGVVSFGVKGGREAAKAFMGNLKIAAIETHVADARTCCLHPASTTHRQMNDEQLAAAGVKPDLVRMSCGPGGQGRPDRRHRPGAGQDLKTGRICVFPKRRYAARHPG